MKRLIALIALAACSSPSDEPTGTIEQAVTVSNGSFETGDYTGWTVQHQTAGTCGTWAIATDGQTYTTGQQLIDSGGNGTIFENSPGLDSPPSSITTYHATDGTHLAIGLQNCAEDHRLFQTVTVPSCQAVVRWDMNYNNHAGSFDATNQFIALNIRNASTDVVLATPYKTTQGVDPTTLQVMTSFLADISSFAGQTVRLDFEQQVELNFFDSAFDNIRVVCKGLSPDQSTLAFGGVPIHNSSTLTTIITNQSNAAITLSQLQLAGTGFSITSKPSLPDAIAPGGTATVSVKFAPTVTGPANGTLTLVSNDPNGNTVIPLSGTGLGPSLSVSPGSLTFATTQTGDTTATQPVTIQNVGGAALTIDSVSIAAPFTVSLVTPVTLTPGQIATANVAFAPTVAGDASATLQIHATDGEIGAVSCTGTGVPPSIALSTPALGYADQRVGTTSTTQPVIVTNTGVGNVTLQSLVAGGPFTIVAAPGTPDTLAPNDTAEIDVAFAPSTAGPAAGTLTITSTAASSPDQVALSGTGIAPVIAAPAVGFGNQHVGTTGTATLFVTNNGTATLDIASLSTAPPFAIATTTASIAPGVTQPFSVTFTPQAEVPFTGTITIASDDPVTPSLSVGVSGTGVLGHVAIAPGALDFNTQRRGTTSAPQTVTITNVGTDTLNISSATLAGGPFAGGLGPTSLAPNAFAQLAVTFSPTVDGLATTTLSVVSDAPTSPDTITVRGTGVEPIATASVASLPFGPQRTGTTSAAQTFTVKNTGTSSLTITSATASGPFAVQPPALPVVLAIGQVASFSATFSPTAAGPVTGSLSIATDATASPSVALTGTGTEPLVAAAPAALAFGNQRTSSTSPTQTITVTNTGTASLAIASATAPAGYVLTPPAGFPIHVLPGAHAAFGVAFAPTALGPDNGAVVFASDAASSPTSVTVTGAGVQAVAAVSPATQDFGDVRVGTTGPSLPLSITNTGNDPFQVTSIAVPAPFVQVSGPSLPATVPANGSLPLSVALAPTAVGAANGTLTIATDTGFVSATLTGQGVASALTASLNPMDFGSVSIHTTATLALQLTNPGTAPLTITSLQLSGAAAADFVLSPAPALPAVVAPGDALTVDVAFTPSDRGARAAQLAAASDALGTPSVAVSLTGRGIGAHVVLTPTTLDFGATNVGSVSPPRSVTVANTGDDQLVVSAVVLGGANGGDFTQAQALPLVIGAGSSADVAFQFAPTAGGERDASATFTTSDPFAPTATLTLVGGGQTPAIAATPGKLDFGAVFVGGALALPLVLANNGTGALTISAFGLVGPDVGQFALDPVTLPIVLAPGGTTTAHLVYEPSAIASHTATLVVTSNDPSNASLQVPLDGTGVSPTVAVSPSSIDFGGQLVGRTSAPRQVTIHNTGTGTLLVTSLAIAGAQADLFQLAQPPQLPAKIPASGSLVLSVTVAPTVIGADAAQLAIETDSPDSPDARVDLAVLGVSTALSVSPSTIDFGTTHVGVAAAPVTITLSNLSGDAISLVDATSAGATPGDFTVSSAAGVVPAGGSAMVTVTYKPAAAASSAATLAFSTKDPAIPDAIVAATGRAVSAFVFVDHASLDFGSIEVGGESGAKTVTIQNATTTPIVIASVVAGDAQFVVDASAVTGATLQPGATATFNVVFAPTSEGAASSTAAVTVMGASGPEVSVALTGVGAARPSAGGCSTTTSPPSLVLVLALALVLDRRRRRSARTVRAPSATL